MERSWRGTTPGSPTSCSLSLLAPAHAPCHFFIFASCVFPLLCHSSHICLVHLSDKPDILVCIRHRFGCTMMNVVVIMVAKVLRVIGIMMMTVVMMMMMMHRVVIIMMLITQATTTTQTTAPMAATTMTALLMTASRTTTTTYMTMLRLTLSHTWVGAVIEYYYEPGHGYSQEYH